MTAFIFATEREARPFLKRYERGRFEGLREGDTVQDDAIVVSVTGVGKIKAALRTERLLHAEHVARIIHPGTCTALTDAYQAGQIVGISQVFEGDRIELSTPSYPRMPLDVLFDELPTGTLVTQDHTPQETSEQTYWQRIAELSDMTGYAVAYVAATYGIPCHIVKIVTGQMFNPDANLLRTLDRAYESLAGFLLEHFDRLNAVSN